MDESIIEDQYYEIEEIRDHRGTAGKREYLVKWAGYGERANTWEPASNFSDPSIIDKYWEKKRQLQKKEKENSKGERELNNNDIISKRLKK